MISIPIKNQNQFMNSLLVSNSFDSFLLKEACILTSNLFTIDGTEHKDFYTKEENEQKISPYDYVTWAKIRPTILNLIKGHNTPLSLKLVLYAIPELADNILGEYSSLVDYLTLSIRFDDSGMSITTGVAYNTFTFEKSADKLWDQYISREFEG